MGHIAEHGHCEIQVECRTSATQQDTTMRAEQKLHAHGPHSRTACAFADSTQENTTTMKSKTKSHSRTRPLLHSSHNCDAIIAACDCICTWQDTQPQHSLMCAVQENDRGWSDGRFDGEGT
jgi:hypothetical protein